MKNENIGLPNSWASVKLGDFVENEKGKKPKSESKTKTDTHLLPYVDIQTFEEGIVRSWTDGTSCRLCHETDFLMVWDGARAGLIGKGVNGALGSTLVRINFPSMVNDYAFYFLLSKYQQINKRAKGSGTPHVDPDLLWNYEFPIPPKNEQHRIVAKIEELFSELDKGIENLKTAREQLKVYRQALLKHAFEGKLTAQWREQNRDKLETATALLARIQAEREQRYQQQLQQWQTTGGSKPKAPKTLPPLAAEELAELPELPGGWAWVKLGDAVETNVGFAFKSNEFSSNGLRLLRGENIEPRRLRWVDTKFWPIERMNEFKELLVKPGEIIIAMDRPVISSGLKVARVKQSDAPCLLVQRVARIKEQQGVCTSYVFSSIDQNRFVNHCLGNQTGTQLPHVSEAQIRAYPVPFCAYEEQALISQELDTRMSEVDQLDQTIITSLQQAEALRQSILKKAFSGQLVLQDANDEPAAALLVRIKSERAAALVLGTKQKLPKTPRKLRSTQTNVMPFPIKITGVTASELHAGIMALAYRQHELNRKTWYFGHVKAEKISHMVESFVGIDLERQPIKDAAGPNDFQRLLAVESLAREMQWFDVQKQKSGRHVLHKLEGFDGLVEKTTAVLGEHLKSVEGLIGLFIDLNKTRSEIVATLYAAWNNLLLLGQKPSDEEIVLEATENWHGDKLEIRRERFFNCLGWMRSHGLMPAGRGRYVAKKGEKPLSGAPL